MNLRLVSYNLGIIALLTASAMIFSMIWALPFLGGEWSRERYGVAGLSISILIGGCLSAVLMRLGRSGKSAPVFTREAIATVGLGWLLAAVISACPYLLSGTCRAPDVPMTVVDALFESVSGLTTTGGTVLSDLENTASISRSILFWRSTTHFIGGLGIILLISALLDTGLSGKLMLRHEMSDPRQSVQGSSRSTLLVRRTVAVYLVLNLALIVLLAVCGLSVYDALCHSFGTVATGGLGTYNDSLAHFRTVLPTANYVAMEWIVGVFMFLSGMHLLGLFFLATGRWQRLVGSSEWRGYVLVVALATCFIAAVQWNSGPGAEETLRTSFFQVASVVTTTGYSTCDYCQWFPAAQMALILTILISPCSGSTAGGPKIVRYILLGKLLRIELERVYRPAIVRPLIFNGERITDTSITGGIFLYFTLMFVTLVVSWAALMFLESPALWGGNVSLMMRDTFAAVVAQLFNVGLSFGAFGPSFNYGMMTDASKAVCVVVMLLGRLDFLAILLLFSPSFWKK